MKITKTKLKQIIKEEIDREQLRKVLQLFTSEDEDQQQMAVALMKSMYDDAETPDTTGISNTLYVLINKKSVNDPDEMYRPRIYGIFNSSAEAEQAVKRARDQKNADLPPGEVTVIPVPLGKLKIVNPSIHRPDEFQIMGWNTRWMPAVDIV